MNRPDNETLLTLWLWWHDRVEDVEGALWSLRYAVRRWFR